MAIESAVFLRRVARSVTLVLFVACMGCISATMAAAVSVAPRVIAGSVLPNQNTLNEFGQIYRLVVAKNGAVLILDSQNGGLYEIKPGASTPITLSASGAVLKGGGNFWNVGMALDNSSPQNLYITGEYSPQPDFYRVPYDSTTGTWPLTSDDSWSAGDTWLGGEGGREVAFDDQNNMYVSTVDAVIYELSVSADGTTVGAPNTNGDGTTSPLMLVKNLTDIAAKMAVDHSGNVFFIENPWEATDKRDVGVWMIPAGTSGITAGVTGLTRLDAPVASSAYNFKGITVDAAGNLYLSSQNDIAEGNGSWGGNEDGVLMLPNESGSPTTATYANFNWNDAVVVSPVSATAAIGIDSRGFLWIPTATSGWTPPGTTMPSAPILSGTYNWVEYALGDTSLGSSQIGQIGMPAGSTTATAGTLFYSFSGNVTPASIAIAQPGTGSDFTVSSTNPDGDDTITPCTAATAYTMWGYCQYWIAVNPRTSGTVAGQVMMLDSSNNTINGSTAFIGGVGQGSGLSFLGSAAAAGIGAGFTSPRQIAVDILGNVYVADAGLKKVLEYPAGSSSASSIVAGLSAPSGVAVDGAGNVYIGDSGNVIKVPFESGALNASDATTVLSGLGNNLNMAADSLGDLYVADTANGRVVKISNPDMTYVLADSGIETVGSGFTSPSAVAVDDAGNLLVADGANLVEINSLGGQSTITTKLSSPVTGLATDASGSVYVAQSGGVLWIPSESGTLTFNDAVQLTAGTDAATTYPGLTAPAGIAVDTAGNQYVSSNSTPSVTELSINGSYDFGVVSAPNPSPIGTDADVLAYNIGNLPLTFSAFSGDSFNNTDFYAEAELVGDIPGCDPSTATNAGMYCYLGLGVMPTMGSESGVEDSGSGTVLSNAPSVSLAVTADSVLDTRNATTTTITSIPASTYPGSATITVTVTSASGTPTGSVSLRVTGHGTVVEQLVSGSVSFPAYTSLQGGSYNVTATYAGTGVAGTDPNFAKSVSSTTFTVNTATPTMIVPPVTTPDPVNSALYVLQGGSDSFTINVGSGVGVPTGTVRVMINGTTPADATQDPIVLDGNGNAVFNTKNIAVGKYTLSVVYSGDQNYSSITAVAPTFNVIEQSVLISASPTSMTLKAGTPGSVTLNFESLVGFGGTANNSPAIVITCDNPTLPQYSECTFSTTTTQVPVGGSVSVVMTISTNIPENVNNTASLARSPWTLAGLFGMGMFGLAFRKRSRKMRRALMMACVALLSLGAILSVSACNNSGYTHTPPAPQYTTPSGSYNVGVTVTSTINGQVVSLPFTLPTTVQ